MRAQSLSTEDRARVDDLLTRHRESILAGLRAALERPGVAHARFMRYHMGFDDAAGDPTSSAAGKMLRPALCLLCCEAVGGDVSVAMPAAVALELLHNFTLIHDDIEDGSAMRHGRQALWRLAGIAQAINAGDGMFVIAQRTLLDMALAGVAPARVLDAARRLNDACIDLCEGQHADIAFETRRDVTLAEYEAMIAGKSGALLGASAAIGAIAGGADERAAVALDECGRMLGMAFQIQDDVLGIWGDPAETGKPAGDDIRSRKKSFPAVWAAEHAGADEKARLRALYASPAIAEDEVREVLALLDGAGAWDAATAQASIWAERAIDALGQLPIDSGRRHDIEALARFVVKRSA